MTSGRARLIAGVAVAMLALAGRALAADATRGRAP